LKRLEPDPATAPVVQRIFAEYLAGSTLRDIANQLNRDGVPCPSAHRPEQYPHRPGDGWQISTLSTIISNQRYTGYEYWGKWNRVEALIDPSDVSLGNRTRFRRAAEGQRRAVARARARSADLRHGVRHCAAAGS
jgi:hypothetical protein